MAIDLWWQGLPDSPSTEAKVVVRVSVTGTIGLTVNGIRFTAAGVTTSSDGIISLVATGLTEGRYGFTLDFNGTDYLTVFADDERALHVFSDSEKSLKIAYGSCDSRLIPTGFFKNMWEKGAQILALLGDCPYTDGATGDYYGVSVIRLKDDTTLSNFYAFNRGFHSDPAVIWIGHRMPIIKMVDDHEYAGDNWDHTAIQATSGNGDISDGAGAGSLTQADVDNAFINANLAWIAYALGNPSNSDSGVAAQAPSEASAATSNYPAKYFRTTINGVELFVTDQISHRDPIRDVAGASKTMLGTTQEAWLLARFAANTTRKSVWVTTKKLFANTTDNSDGWGAQGSTFPGYHHERDVVASAMPNGMITISGDRHCASIAATNTDDGDAYDSVNVCACPYGGQQVNASQGVGYATNVRWLGAPKSVAGEILKSYSVIGLLVFDGEYTESRIYNYKNELAWQGRVVVGSKKLSYPTTKVSRA